MLSYHDTQSSLASNEEAVRGADFLSVSTFLKPQFRIAVAPISGELQVQVELRSSDVKVRHSTRH
jgi:hypothetical protein